MTNLEIIEENSDYIVVNKTAGLISEKSPFEDCTVENLVESHLLKSKPKPYVGVIHRLDRVTSGVLIFAKKKNVLVRFNELFSSRKVQKTYLAIVATKPPKDKDVLTHYLVKNQLEKRADIVKTKSKEAQECILSYELIDKNEFGYILEIKPKTGRFHQIRAQLAYIGLPVIGDGKYGSDKAYQPLSICLHSSELTYQEFNSKEKMTFKAALPKNDFWKFESF